MSIPRRPITPGIRAFAEGVIAHVNKYSDPFFQVSSWSTFERSDDKLADLQIAVRILEHLPDPDAALGEMVKLARKVAACLIEVCDGRTADDWRALLERHIRIARFDVEDARIVAIGQPKLEADNLFIVGPVTFDDQWDQLAANSERIKARIEPAPAHDRRLILACYGPSLADNVEVLRQFVAEGGDVATVSAAHDFLIERGITPKYHVDCDPRAHKAVHINAACPGVEYLLASCVHPDLLDKLEGATIKLWHTGAADHAIRLVDNGENPATIIGGGSSVGLRSIPLFYALGYRDFAIFAMDCSFADDGAQWAGKHAGKIKKVREVRIGDRVFLTSQVLLGYACQFFELVQRVNDIKWELVGDGLLQEMAKHYANGTLETAA